MFPEHICNKSASNSLKTIQVTNKWVNRQFQHTNSFRKCSNWPEKEEENARTK